MESCQVVPGAGRHQARARAWNAPTEGASWIQPPDGPAPTPTPQFEVHHNTSPIPWAAAVQPPSVRLVLAQMPSAPSLMRPSRGRVAAHASARPWSDQAPPGSEASEPATLPWRASVPYSRAGAKVAELKLVPPGKRTVPTPTPSEAWVCASEVWAHGVPSASIKRTRFIRLERSGYRWGGNGLTKERGTACCAPTVFSVGRFPALQPTVDGSRTGLGSRADGIGGMA